MALATLSIDLVAKLAQFEADMGKAARATEKTANQIAGAFGLIKSAAGGLASGIGVAGIVAFTRSVVNSLDALNDLKDATGSSVENISALEDVAIRTGTSFETVGASLIKFNAALNNAKPGSDIEAAFDAIGLSVKDLKALDPAEALRQTAVALAGFADDGNKARLSQELFGKSLREVAPFLKDLSEQARLNASVTTEQAEAAEKFNKELFAMQKNLQDVSRSLVGPVLTGMNGLIEKFREGSREGDGFIKTLLKQTEIARLLNLESAGKGFTGGGRNSGLAALTGSTEIGGGYDRSAARLKRQGKLSIDFDGATKPTPKGGKPRAEQLTDEQRALASYVEGLQRALEKTEDLTATEKALNFLRFSGRQSQVPQVRELVLGLAKQIDETKRLREESEALLEVDKALAEQAKRKEQAYQDRLKSLTDNTPSQVFKRQQEDLEFLQQALEKGALRLDQYTESVRELFNLNEERMEKSKSLAEELGLSFTSAFEDAIVGGKKFSDVLKGLEQDILRIVTRDQVTRPLADSIGKLLKGDGNGGSLLSNIGGYLGKVLGFEGGGFTGGGARSGGLDGRGGFLGVLHPNETVIDHTRGQRGGNVVSVVINQSFAPGTNRATTMQAAADARRQLEYAGRNL